MSGPYGIVQVDVPGAINAYRVGQQDRINQLKVQREQAAYERQMKVQEAITRRLSGAGAVVDSYGPKGGDQSSGGAAVATPAPPPATAATPPAKAPANPLFDPASQQALLSELTTIDAGAAIEMAQTFSQLNEGQSKRIKDVYKTIGNAALHLRNLPPQERASELRRIAPSLLDMGVPQDKIAGFDLSDRSLEYLANQVRDVEAIIDQTAPKVMPLQPGGTIGEYTPASPFPTFEATVQGGPITAEQAEPIIVDAQQTGVISQANAEAFIRSVGRGNFEAWAKKYNVKVANTAAPVAKTVNGKTYYQINGKWYDNPEGR